MRLFALLFITILTFSSAHATPLNVGGTAENWNLETAEGETLDYYADSEGKVSVILFWATWCPYCATLMPHLEVVYRKYRSKGLKFYAISIQEDGAIDPAEYFEAKKLSYTLLTVGDLVAEDYGVKGTPSLYVVDKDKKVVYKRPSGVSDVLVKQNVDLKVKQALAN